MEVSNRFYALETVRDVKDIEDYWDKTRGVWKESCEEVLGLRGKFQSGDKPMRARDGKLLRSQDKQKNRWKEHFAELLNRPLPDNPPNIEPAEVDLEIDLEPPSTWEVLGAIKKN
ncbi:hypothetical protein ElyMa_006490200 [Elysia marginata]|uniref:Uncharacterized protein n=1 Tax=Elysia marginata TaxID=1093978 RepID=A0AAV4I2S5_9GAST|nr:hypothetical protein ElyMa_006490200 [Elysia marginata]